jgi:spermidine synthase
MIIFIPLGIITVILQLVILREFSFSIAKHELIFIVATGLWIISCALGGIVKLPKKPIKDLKLPVITSLCFSFSICLAHLAKSLIGLKYYEATSLGIATGLSLAVIGPTAFILGLAFKQLVQKHVAGEFSSKNIFAKFFAFEAIGFCLGGVAFTFFFKDYSNPFIFSLLPLILLPDIKNLYHKSLSAALIIIITVISVISFNSIIQKEFAGADILVNLGSGYGPVIAVRKSGVTTLFSAGSLLATSEDKSTTEEFIHMSLSAEDPLTNQDVLFIGAAVSGQIEEITKYKLSSLDCLQINPLIWKFTRNLGAGELGNKINFITSDPRSYLKETGKKYDAILMNMPAPSNLALNRYFTEDFFKLIAACLKPKGIFSFAIPSKREILSPQFIKFDSSIINALDKVFASRLLIPSDSMVVIASNRGKINDRYLLNNFAKTNPKTDFFTIYHFKDYLAPAMRSYAQNLLDKKTTPNTDLDPSGFLNYLILEQTKFYPGLNLNLKTMQLAIGGLLLLSGFLIIMLSCFSEKISCLLNIGAVGFTSISLSSIIFILFQLSCAALFWKLGLLIALFMAGLSSGVFFMEKIKIDQINLLRGLYLCWIIAISILFFNLKTIGRSDYAEFIFYFYALLCGFLTGSAYPLLSQSLLRNKFKSQNITITIYSADLIGAFLGTLACGILLIPFLGITYSLLALISLNAIFALKNLRG